MDDDPDHQLITVQSEDPTISMDQPALLQICSRLTEALGVSELHASVLFVSADRMTELNNQYRSKPSVTDVLSFDQFEWSQPQILNQLQSIKFSPLQPTLGDVVLCAQQAARQAIELGHSLGREIVFLLVHGFLHLCGHDHQNSEDETLMCKQQNQLMKILGCEEHDFKELVTLNQQKEPA